MLPMPALFTRLKRHHAQLYAFLNDGWIKRTWEGLTIYASGRNLYTWTKWDRMGPGEQLFRKEDSGDWTNNYPTIRSVVFGP